MAGTGKFAFERPCVRPVFGMRDKPYAGRRFQEKGRYIFKG